MTALTASQLETFEYAQRQFRALGYRMRDCDGLNESWRRRKLTALDIYRRPEPVRARIKRTERTAGDYPHVPGPR